jgi:hypothetical protein
MPRASVMLTKLDITTVLPEREMTQPYVLQMASRETIPILKDMGGRVHPVAVTTNDLLRQLQMSLSWGLTSCMATIN